jgi:hypothetical protein
MSTDPDQIREEIEETRASLSQDVNTLADTVNPAHAARRKAASARAAVRGVKDKVMGTASQSVSGTGSAIQQVKDKVTGAASDSISGTGSAARDKMSAAQEGLRRQATGNPLAVGLIAVGVGWLVGSLLPASSVEEQAAVKVKEAALPAVTEAAKDTAATLRDSAQEAVGSVKATAADAAATVRDEAVSSAQDVRDQAYDARDAVTESRE